MRTFLPTLVVSVLLCGSCHSANADDTPAKAPDANAEIRLKFLAYDGNEKARDKMTFQIAAADILRPTEFLKIGDMIPRTPFKLTKFVYKAGAVSELTIVNTKTKKEFILVLGTDTTVR